MNKNAFDGTKFGDALRRFRKRAGKMTLARLSVEIDKVGVGVRISATALHYLETARYKRQPLRETVKVIVRALCLSPSEGQELLELAGYSVGSESLLDRAMESIGSVLKVAGQHEAEGFLTHLQAFTNKFSRALSARNEQLHLVLIPIAGWQARVLASPIVEQMLLPAIHEAANAGIDEVVLITAPGMSSKWSLRERFRDLSIHIVEQDQPAGLGRALIAGRPANHFAPIGVILPDEVDPRGEALKDLARQYQLVHRPIVAVNPSPADREKTEILRYYGIAILKGRKVGQSSKLRELQAPLIEKPQEPRACPPLSRKIAGRYILTPEIFETMELTGPELTAALNEYWKSLYAYELHKDLIALSPYQGIIEVMSSLKSTG